MSRRSINLILLVAVIGFAALMIIEPAWALSVTPDPPTANQAFTISLPSPTTGVLYVMDSSGCVGGSVVFSGYVGPPSYSVSVPGQPAGQYSAFVGTVSTCVDFTVAPA